MTEEKKKEYREALKKAREDSRWNNMTKEEQDKRIAEIQAKVEADRNRISDISQEELNHPMDF